MNLKNLYDELTEGVGRKNGILMFENSIVQMQFHMCRYCGGYEITQNTAHCSCMCECNIFSSSRTGGKARLAYRYVTFGEY